MRTRKVLNKNLTDEQKYIINNARIKEWGIEEKKDLSKDFEPDTIWFFVEDNKKIVALCGLRLIKIKYCNKDYVVRGICSVIALEKGKGYGKLLTQAMIDYSKKSGETILGFTLKTEIFRRCGLKVEKDFIKRFVWVKKNGERVLDNEGDGIYFEGKDEFVSKVLEGEDMVKIDIEFW